MKKTRRGGGPAQQPRLQDPASALAQRLLEEIGEGLDREQYPSVYRNGLVKPGPGRPPETSPGGGTELYVSAPEGGSPRPAAGEGQGPAGHGSADGAARSSASEALLLRAPGLTPKVRHDLGAAIDEYRDTWLRIVAPETVWLLTRIRPIPGLPDEPLLLTAYPLRSRFAWPCSWAWWSPGDWIGPRHINFDGTGSICSFERTHGTWKPGDPLLRLLDLHTGWVVRHMHLRYFGRWPGPQVIHTAYERLREQLPGELCGACDSMRPYEVCCRPEDIARGSLGREREFKEKIKNPLRKPVPVATQMVTDLLRSGIRVLQ